MLNKIYNISGDFRVPYAKRYRVTDSPIVVLFPSLQNSIPVNDWILISRMENLVDRSKQHIMCPSWTITYSKLIRVTHRFYYPIGCPYFVITKLIFDD
jgi:hypothetical protein